MISKEEVSDQDHGDAGRTFFSQSAQFKVVLWNGLGLCEYVKEVAGWNYEQ